MTTIGELVRLPGVQAGADLSSYQYRFVKHSAAGKVTYCSTTGEPALGVLQDKPDASGKAAYVAGFNGTTTKVVAGAAVSSGATIMTDTAGRAITHTTGKCRLGVAMSAATAAGEMIDVVLVQNGVDIGPNKGVIEFDITTAREIASNDLQNLAAHGGLMATDSTPPLARVNGATDKAIRLAWAASNSNEIAFAPRVLPHDFDSSADATIHLLAAMAGTTDTPTVAVYFFQGIGDTNAGGNTAAVTGTTLAEYTVTIANANLAAAPSMINVGLTPAAHTTDILYLYGCWMEYQRKVN